MKAVEIKELTKRYGNARGVDTLSFDIEEGEVFGYLGPNGSGKTTTIRCLMGLLKPTSGRCCVLGTTVAPGRATQHRRIGYLPGDFRIWGRLTARKALGVLASLGGGNGIDDRRDELAQKLDLDLDRRIGALSKGNRQKVGIIYAFQHKPDLLILDEPTIGLDPLVRQAVLELIREVAAAGATILLSSHDLSEVAAVCQRAAILREGRLVELAPISQIVQEGEKRLKVWFARGAEPPALSFSNGANRFDGMRVIRQNAESLEIAYQGSADAVLKWLARFPVDRIATPETSLEDAFIQYYRRESGREQ